MSRTARELVHDELAMRILLFLQTHPSTITRVVAGSLDVPYVTANRKVNEMIEAGIVTVGPDKHFTSKKVFAGGGHRKLSARVFRIEMLLYRNAIEYTIYFINGEKEFVSFDV
jgi:hypothetical protein